MPEEKPLNVFIERRKKIIQEERDNSLAKIEHLKKEKEEAMKKLCDHIAKTAENGMTTEEMIDREKGEMTSDEIYSMHDSKIRQIDSETERHRQRLSELDHKEREILTDGTSHSAVMALTNDALPYKIKVDDLEDFLRLNEENELNAPKSELARAELKSLIPLVERLSAEYPHLFEDDGRLKEHVRQRLNLIKW